MCYELVYPAAYSRLRTYVRCYLSHTMHGLRTCRCRRPIQNLFRRAPHLRSARAEHVLLPPTYPTADRVIGARSAGCGLCTRFVARAGHVPSPPTYPLEVVCRARAVCFPPPTHTHIVASTPLGLGLGGVHLDECCAGKSCTVQTLRGTGDLGVQGTREVGYRLRLPCGALVRVSCAGPSH